MLRKLKALIILAGFCVSCGNGCATTTPIVTAIGHAVDCSANAVVSQLPGIMTDVVTDLLSKDYMKLLTDLATRVGDDAVACGVAASTGAARARLAAGTAAQPNAEAVAGHGEEYLRLRDVRFTESSTSFGASAPYCQPSCNSCQRCIQLTGGQPPVLLPPVCAPKSPKPPGC